MYINKDVFLANNKQSVHARDAYGDQRHNQWFTGENKHVATCHGQVAPENFEQTRPPPGTVAGVRDECNTL